MKTWNDITIGSEIFILVENNKNGAVDFYKRKCVDIDKGKSYLIFTYDNDIESFGDAFGVLGDNINSNRYRYTIKTIDMSICYYCNQSSISTDLKTLYDNVCADVMVIEHKRDKCRDLIDELRN